MIELSTVILILFLHFIADFLLQPHWIASNKYKCGKEMAIHGTIYLLVLAHIDPAWALLNTLIHVIVDAWTSNVTHKLYEREKYGAFFKVIGLDQFIHTACLLLTYVKFVV